MLLLLSQPREMKRTLGGKLNSAVIQDMQKPQKRKETPRVSAAKGFRADLTLTK